MTESKKAVEGKQTGNPPSGANKQTAGSIQNKKPAAPKAQVKSVASRSTAKAAPLATKETNASSDTAKLKENAARAEALESRNILLSEERGTQGTESSDVTGVIVPTDKEELKVKELIHDKENNGQEKSGGKHKKKDRDKQLKTAQTTGKTIINQVGKPVIDKVTLEQKTAKAEKKVNKLQKKVQKARKKEVKKSKLIILKEKLIKAFSKWQRRKKKMDATD